MEDGSQCPERRIQSCKRSKIADQDAAYRLPHLRFKQSLAKKDHHDVSFALPLARVRHIGRNEAELMRRYRLPSYAARACAPGNFALSSVKGKQQFRVPMIVLRPAIGFQASVIDADFLAVT